MAEEVIWKDRKRYLGLPLSFTRYRLTESRIFIETGCFSLKEDEVLLYRIRDLSLTRSFGQRLFGVGTVLSSDKSVPNLELKNIRHPKDVKELIHVRIEAQKDRKNLRATELLGTDTMDGIDDLEQNG